MFKVRLKLGDERAKIFSKMKEAFRDIGSQRSATASRNVSALLSRAPVSLCGVVNQLAQPTVASGVY